MKTDVIDFADGSKTIYYYDDQDLEMKVEDVDSSGKVIMTVERVYDQAGKCSGWSICDANGAVIKRFELSYDQVGNKTETRQYDNRGNLEHILSSQTG